MSTSAEIQNDLGSRIPPHFSPIMRGFFIGVFLGNVAQFDEKQVEDLVNGYFPPTPLIPISPLKESALRRDIRVFCQATFRDRDPQYQAIAEDVVFVAQAAKYAETQYWPTLKADTPLFVTGRWAEQLHKKLGLPYLTPTEKERLLTDPQIWLNGRIITTLAGLPEGNGLARWTTRHLYSSGIYPRSNIYGYGYAVGDYEEILEAARNAQGKNPSDELLILDIGGSNGLAAYDMEQVDLNSAATNLTIEPQLGVFPLKGGHLLGLAERLPGEFRNKFDVVISHMAFIYMRYPHIALINALYALRVGGVMDISFDWSRSGDIYGKRYMSDKELKPVFVWIEALEKEGIVEYYIPRHSVISAMSMNTGYPPYHGQISLIVKKPIEPGTLQPLHKILTGS